MTRTVKDMLAILDVLTTEDETAEGDFWCQQTFVDVPKVERPASYLDLLEGATDALRGKRIAVPSMYIGSHDPAAKPTTVSPAVIQLWQRARSDLESLGATVLESDIPLVTNYENDTLSGHTNNVQGFPPDWNSKERGELVAYLWDDFLKANADPKNYPGGLAEVDGSRMFPDRPEGYLPDKWLETKNFMDYRGLVELARNRPEGKTIWDIEGIASALPALEAQRKRDLEAWMDAHSYDLVVFPANGDVGAADLETNPQSAEHALQNGVKYSNGNRAIRHMGVPTVSVTMGRMEWSRGMMPVNLTFVGKHGQDSELLRYAYAFEQHARRRVMPPLTPALGSDEIRPLAGAAPEQAQQQSGSQALELTDVLVKKIGLTRVRVSGKLSPPSPDFAGRVAAYVKVPGSADFSSPAVAALGTKEDWELESDFEPFEPVKPLCGGYGVGVGKVSVLLRAWVESEGVERTTGKLVLV